MADREPHAEVVSSETELLILVDAQDNEVGQLDKGSCHDGDGILHRAFSLFLFNDGGDLLLQQRAPGKRLWPLFWSNSCCSHPRVGETMEFATGRRLGEELGMTTDLHYLFKFSYAAAFGDLGSERELCSVFIGRARGEPRFNATEIRATRWVSPEALDAEFEESPESLTPWFAMEWQRIRAGHMDAVRAL